VTSCPSEGIGMIAGAEVVAAAAAAADVESSNAKGVISFFPFFLCARGSHALACPRSDGPFSRVPKGAGAELIGWTGAPGAGVAGLQKRRK